MKVCTYNIWSDAPRNTRWGARRDLLAGVLEQHAPDVAGLQEATFPMLRDLSERLPGYRWVGVGREDGAEIGEYTPIFYHASRVTLLEQSTLWLADSCEKPLRGWDAACFRIVTWARFREHASGREFVHFNTHFDHLGRRARRESALLLRRKLVEIARGAPALVTGDLNARESSAVYRILTGQVPLAAPPEDGLRLRDSLYASEGPPVGPSRTYLGLLGYLGMGRIDYVFVDPGFRVLQHQVLETSPVASDHRPVLVELSFA